MAYLPLPAFSPDHLHPILVNFTAALLPASVASDVFGRALRKQSLHVAAWWMLVYAAGITPLTGLAGLWWKKSAGAALPTDILRIHQWLGISLAVLFIVMAIWRRSFYARGSAPSAAYLLLGITVVAALIYQGTLGGVMLFGS
jgi:uncharacterized membrane protein